MNLAVMYTEGEGVAANKVEALKWFRQAAEQGFAEGQTALGVMYALGQGVEADLVQANKWLALAAAQGDADAQVAHTELATKLSPAQLAESKKLTEQWQAQRKPVPAPEPEVPEVPKPE